VSTAARNVLSNTVTRNQIKDIIFSNLLEGLDGALERIINQLVELYKVSSHYLTPQQCKEIVQTLDEYHFFLLRDSVNTVSQMLPISRVSIYKYLRK
jgi:predicted transcriptional regulator YheO